MSETLYVFDLDDTLITNRAVDLEAFNAVLAKHGLPALTGEKLLALRKKGLAAEQIFQQLAPAQAAQLTAERKDVLHNTDVWKHATLNTGALAKLKSIKAAGNVAVLVTRQQPHITEFVLQQFKLTDFFASVHTKSADKAAVVKQLLVGHAGAAVFVSDSEQDFRSMDGLPVQKFCMYNAYTDKERMASLAKVITSLEELP